MDLIYRYDPFAPIETVQVPTAASAMNELVSGNDRFVGMVQRMQQRTLGADAGEPIIIPFSPVMMGLPLYEGAMPQQTPYAAVLGCSDARVPIESVFDQSFNKLFVLRIAGNVLGAECLGSLHYAVTQLQDSLKLVVVLGHSKCGAVTAAVDAFLSVTEFADISSTYPLRSLLDQIQISVRGAARAFDRLEGPEIRKDPDFRTLLVSASVYLNAAVTAHELRRELSLQGSGPEVVFGVYDLETLRVQGLPATAEEASSLPRLRRGPADSNELMAYAAEVVKAVIATEKNNAPISEVSE